jgi:hypothetical protein
VSFAPEWLYLTHYGRVGDVPRLATRMLSLLDAMVLIGRRVRGAADRHAVLKHELTQLYAASLAEHGVEPTAQVLDLLSMDIELNAQGIAVWLDRQANADTEGQA